MQPFTLFDFTSGLDQSREDWLISDKSFTQFDEGYVDLGFIKGREGYDQFADGGEGSAAICESRMVARIDAEDTGATGTGTVNYTTANNPLRRGTVTLDNGTATATDDGDGNIAGGTVNYTTGQIAGAALGSGAGAVTVQYDYHPGLPVMMIANYVNDSNARQLIVADTKFINRLNTSTNRLDDISQTYTITNVVPGSPNTVTLNGGSPNHQLLPGMKVLIYGVVGVTGINNTEVTIDSITGTTFTFTASLGGSYTSGGTVKVIFTGTDKDFFHWVNYPDQNDSNLLVFTNNTDPVHYLDSSSNIKPLETNSGYEEPDGAQAYDSTAGPPATYTFLKALRVHYQKDRLILLRTSWRVSGSPFTLTTYPKRILISGFGANALKFKSSNPGAGQIDLPDQRWISSSEDSKDDLLIETEMNPWVLKYTGNDVVPFTLQRIGVTSGFTGGSNAPMSSITHRDITYTVNKAGLIGTDGQSVQRADDLIPNFILNEIKADDIEYVFSGIQKDDKFIMMLYPSDVSTSGSDDILVLNYDHYSFSRFRTPLSSIGNYQESFDITWDDLSIFSSWEEFASVYGSWNQIAYTTGSIVTILGGHNGQIWRGFQDNSLDNPVIIRGIVNANPTFTITTDYNTFQPGDVVYITGTSGSTELNNQSLTVQSRTDDYTFVAEADVPFDSVSAYTSGGMVARQIPFRLTTKKFNPFIEQGRQVRVGWCEVYCDVVGNPGDNEHLNIRFFKGDYDETIHSGYPTELPFEVLLSNRAPSTGVTSTQNRVWKRFRINQTGNFFTLQIANESPLRNFKIHAIRLGMAPAGPLRDQ